MICLVFFLLVIPSSGGLRIGLSKYLVLFCFVVLCDLSGGSFSFAWLFPCCTFFGGSTDSLSVSTLFCSVLVALRDISGGPFSLI